MILAFSSCKNEDGGTQNSGGNNNGTGQGNAAPLDGDYIFTKGSSLSFIVSSAEADKTNEGSGRYAEICNEVYQTLSMHSSDITVSYSPDTADKAMREIIIGRCDRELSRQAYRTLERIESEEGDGKFVIYSNGASVAIAYTDRDYDVAEIAVDYFLENYVNGKNELVLEVGYHHSKVVNMEEYFSEKGKAELADQWEQLEKNILADYKAYYADDLAKAEKLTADTIAALRVFYASFDREKLVKWFANLYEPDICVCNALHGAEECEGTPYCGGAGFYFSNGGRDTAGFMPDLESTAQTFGFLKNSGMLSAVGGDISKAFPDGQAEKIVKWVKAMQSPENNGYFYHPQWSVQESNANIARIGRDLGHAVNILRTFGQTPDYPTPAGVGGDGDSTLPVSYLSPSEDRLTLKLGSSSVPVAVSRVVAVSDSATPDHMLTEEAWRKYLAGLNIKTNSYLVANEISSSSSAILARDKELAAMNADYRLTDILMDWFAVNQNPETGTWHWGATDDPYYANNGVLKIITTYQSLGREFPNPLPAIENAINALTCDTPINHVCDLYNTWFTISFICDNLRKYGNSTVAAEVVWALREKAPEAIKATAAKMADCKCEDGSFSYHPGVTSTTAQGLPVAPPGMAGASIKGDVNATVICTYGNINYMFGALYLSGAPSICTDADRRVFKNIISGLGQVVKLEEIDPYNPDTFDDISVGNSANYKFLTTDSTKGSYLAVAKDNRPDSDGNIMQLHSGVGSWDRFIIPTKTGLGGDAFIFETDICFSRAVTYKNDYATDVTSGSLMQLVLGSGENATSGFYSLNAVLDNGVITLRDISSSKDGAPSSQYTELVTGLSIGEWFYIRLEHYRVDESTIRVKVFVGESREKAELVAVSDNFFDYYATKIDNESAIPPAISVYATSMLSVSTNIEQDVLFDNLCIYKARKPYTEEELPLNKNVDGPDQPEVKFDFTDLDALPEDIGLLTDSSTVSVSDGYLKLAGAKIEIDANYRERKANVASLSADVLWSEGSGGNNLMSVLFTEGEVTRYNVMGFDFKVKSISGQSYLVLYERNGDGTIGKSCDLIKIAKGVSTNIRIDYYHTENVALIYVNGDFIVALDSVYSNTKPRLIDRVEISSETGSVCLNNIVFDRHRFDFAVAVEPETESDIHGFDSLEAETAKGTVIENAIVSGGKANLYSVNSKVSLDLVERTPIISAHQIRFTLIPGTSTSGNTARAAIVDDSGNIIIAVDVALTLATDGIKVDVYETGKGGRYDLIIASKMVKYGNDIVIGLVWFPEEAVANVEICGETLGSTSVCYDVGVSDNTPKSGVVYSIASSGFYIDDMLAESLYKYRNEVSLGGANKENGAEKLTYDFSAATNLPKSFTMSLRSGGSAVRIEQALKNIAAAAEYSKALVIESKSGSNDEFRFAPSNTTSGANRVVFETEMMLSSKSSKSSTLFQIMFTDTQNSLKDITYMPAIGIINDMVVLTDLSSTGKNPDTGDYRYENKYVEIGKVDEWFKLRIEYYQGDKDTVRIVITVNDGDKVNILKRKYDANGNALYTDANGNETTDSANNSPVYEVESSVNTVVSDNYYGYRAVSDPYAVPENNIKQVLFYGQTGPQAVMYFDNTSFFGDGATYIGGDVNLVKVER